MSHHSVDSIHGEVVRVLCFEDDDPVDGGATTYRDGEIEETICQSCGAKLTFSIQVFEEPEDDA